jgi:zinc protease
MESDMPDHSPRRGAFAVIRALALAVMLTLPEGGTTAREAKGTSEFFLPSGLRVVVIPDHRVPVVTHMVWYAVGSVEEEAGAHGIAHYLEHMMFKGTAKYPKGVFDRFVASRGGLQNARTWARGTMYWQRAPKSALPQLMDMEADRMVNLEINDADVASERAVVMEELRRQQVGIGYDLGNLMRAALYEDHPEAHTPIGTAQSIAGFDGAKAQDFYRRFYGPSRAMVIVAGDVTEREVRDLVDATYAKVPARTDLSQRTAGKALAAGVSRRVSFAHERASVVSVYKNYLVSSAALSWREQFAATLFGVAAGNGMTSRLFRDLVADKGLATSVSCSYTLGSASSFGQFDCGVDGRSGAGAADIEAALEASLRSLAERGITEEEFDEVKSRFIASEPLRRDNVYERAEGIGGRIFEGVPIDLADDQNKLVAEISREEVESVGRRILTEARNVTGILLPKPLAAEPAMSKAD